MAVTARQAVAAARAEMLNPTRDYEGLCLKFTRTMLKIPRAARTAREAWEDTDPSDRYKSAAPAGTPEYWEVGTNWHVGLSAGGGQLFSTDIKRRGRVDLVPRELIAQRWGAKRLGWAATLNGVRVWSPAPPRPKPAPAPAGEVVTVRRGDTLTGLTAAHAPAGTDWRTVWADPHNAALRALRVRPERIRPGDHVWIP